MAIAIAAVEVFQCRFSMLDILWHARIVQFVQDVAKGRELVPSPDRFGNWISTRVCNRETLFYESPQPPPPEWAKPPIHGHDTRRLFTDLFDLWIYELKRTASCLPQLTEEIEFGFVSKSGVNPTMIEPYDLEVSATVINNAVDYHHFASWYSAQSHALYSPAEENPRARLEALIEACDACPVLVTTGQVEQQIEDSVEAFGRQRLGAFRTDALEFRQRVPGKQFCRGRLQLSSISNRHWIVPKTTVSPLATGTNRPATKRTPLTKVPFIVPTSSMTP